MTPDPVAALRGARRRLATVGYGIAERRWGRRHGDLLAVVDEVGKRHLTYLKPGSLRDLARMTTALDARGRTGAVIEAGAALGGSAVVLARAKSLQRPMYVYDTFGLIPEPSERDGAAVRQRYDKIRGGQSRGLGGEVYYGYRDDLMHEVTRNLASFGVDLERDRVSLVKGRFQDTMAVDFPVALAHIDADWYDSVRTCLERIGPAVVRGGRFVIDDYEYWSGAREAVDEFLGTPTGRRYRREWRSRLHLVRR